MHEKPPIGLRPRHIAEDQRAEEILDAMLRFVHAGKFKDIPADWMQELVDLHGMLWRAPISKTLDEDYYAGFNRRIVVDKPIDKPWNQPGIVFCGTTPSGDTAP